MTPEEYDRRLRELSNEEFRKFTADFGGEHTSIERRVREFVDHPEYERLICSLLGLKTEDEKLTTSALNSAYAAGQSASSAKLSMIWSAIAALAAIATVVLSFIRFFSKG